jgi:hypothetical protein
LGAAFGFAAFGALTALADAFPGAGAAWALAFFGDGADLAAAFFARATGVAEALRLRGVLPSVPAISFPSRGVAASSGLSLAVIMA